MNTDISEKITGQQELSEPLAPVGQEVDNREMQSKADKRREKLSVLKEKYNKAVLSQAAAEKKTKDITAQISKIERELHAEEVSELDKVCKEKGVTYSELILLLREIPENAKLSDVLKIIK